MHPHAAITPPHASRIFKPPIFRIFTPPLTHPPQVRKLFAFFPGQPVPNTTI